MFTHQWFPIWKSEPIKDSQDKFEDSQGDTKYIKIFIQNDTKFYLFFLTCSESCLFLSNPEYFHLFRHLKIAKMVGDHRATVNIIYNIQHFTLTTNFICVAHFMQANVITVCVSSVGLSELYVGIFNKGACSLPCWWCTVWSVIKTTQEDTGKKPTASRHAALYHHLLAKSITVKNPLCVFKVQSADFKW